MSTGVNDTDNVYSSRFSGAGPEDNIAQSDISSGGVPNKNTEWMENPYTWAIYGCFVAIGGACLIMPGVLSLADATTLLNVLHGVATFAFFHWIKGSPDEWSQGEWNGLTFWEQLDAGLPYTATKKFLMLIPAILCLIATFMTDYKFEYMLVNVPVFVILVIAKLPAMHRVRILSINATTGIDDHIRRTHHKVN